MNKDYYKSLGVSKSASKEEIKSAFRKLAHEHHPDKGGNQEKFKEASEAYSVLSDDGKRAQYDQFGSAGPGAHYGGGGFNSQDFGGFDFSNFAQGGAQGFDFDLGDVFGDFFGGGARQKAKRGQDIQVDLEIPFKESVFGVEKIIRLSKHSKCSECAGSGAKKGSAMQTCPTCSGAGRVRQTSRSIFGTFATEKICDTCDGSGKVPKEKCAVCHGHGIVKKEEQFSVQIPVDVNDGETIRLSGAGEAIKGGATGDLYIRLHVKHDPLFKKEGKNLVTELNIKLSDALLGATYPVKTLDGDIELKVPEGAEFGQILRVKGKGVPGGRSGGRGDLLVKLNIKLPSRLSKDAKKKFEELRGEL